MTIENIQDIAFKMIGIIAQAKYKAFSAFKDYKKDSNISKFKIAIKEAELQLGKVGKIHMDVIISEAKGEAPIYSAIFLHAEDQFMTVQMMIEILVLIGVNND